MTDFSRKGMLAAALVASSAGVAAAQDAQVTNCGADGTSYCDIIAGPGFSPDTLSSTGVSGGPVSTNDCGNIDTIPDHTITLTSDFSNLRVHVESQGDVTLVVQGPFGRVCDDDGGEGLLPQIERDWPAGSYQVWVGDWQTSWTVDAAVPYTINVTETSGGQGGSANNGGVVGGGSGGGDGAVITCADGSDVFCAFTLTPGFLPDPVSNGGISGGPIATPDCGNIDTTPDHIVEITDEFPYLRAYVEADGDVTLVVQGPFGRVCSDDVVGLMPEIGQPWPAGTYQVWIGDFGTASNYTLFFSEFER